MEKRQRTKYAYWNYKLFISGLEFKNLLRIISNEISITNTFTKKIILMKQLRKQLTYVIIFNKVYVLQNENNVNELICTYNVDTQDGIDYNKVERST